jgi:hypothetical protein
MLCEWNIKKIQSNNYLSGFIETNIQLNAFGDKSKQNTDDCK